MKTFLVTRRVLRAFVLGLALVLPAAATANVSDTVRNLDEIVRLWEQQLRDHGNRPSAEDCKQLRDTLEAAKAELARERQRLRDALANPPQAENANGGVTAAWAREMANWQRRLDQAEKALADLERRLNALCGPGVVGGGGCQGAGAGAGGCGPARERPPVPTFDPRTHEYRNGQLVPRRPAVPTYDPRTHQYRNGVLVPKAIPSSLADVNQPFINTPELPKLDASSNTPLAEEVEIKIKRKSDREQ